MRTEQRYPRRLQLAILWALIGACSPAAAEDPQPFYEEDFEDATRIAEAWKAVGSDSALAVVATDRGASGQQSLALTDDNSEAFGRWLSRDIDLPPHVIDRGTLRVRWKVLHSITGKGMRLTVVFSTQGRETTREHLFMTGDSPGWGNNEFTPVEHEVAIPPESTSVSFSFVSSSLKNEVSGSCYLDDLVLE
jgi:hypothetical protein